MTATNLEPAAISRFVAGTMVDDRERAQLAESVLRALVAGPYADRDDQQALRALVDGASPGLLARLLEDQPADGPYGRLAEFVAHVMRVGAALLRLATDTGSMAVLVPHLAATAGALPDGRELDVDAACAHLIALARQMQSSALAGDIEVAWAQASFGARVVRVCAGQMPGTLGPLRELVDTDLDVDDIAGVRKDYCDLAARLLSIT